MPIIAYQSFNANTSSTHGLNSLSFQRFTKSTNKVSRKRGNYVLEYPTDPNHLNEPIEGPANKRRIAEIDEDQHTVGIFGSHISQAWQHFQRQFLGMPDLMVIGEMDSSHEDFKSFVGGSNMTVESFSNKKACQSFSAICQNPQSGQVYKITSGIGYVVYSVYGLNVVFVHVPNEFATKRGQMENFYSKIAQDLNSGGKVIHVVLGDTNQRQTDFTAAVLDRAFGVTCYETASPKASLVDTWPPLTVGTNSNGTLMYDVAVYRSDVLDLKHIAYISQSPTTITVTDHCGLAIQVEQKGTN